MRKGSRAATLPARKLLSLDALLRAARAAGVHVTRRALQFYYSPRIRLLPPPVYRGGHVAYFDRGQLHRLKAIKTLQSRYRLSLSAIRELLEAVSDTDIRTLAEGRVDPLHAQIVLHHLRMPNTHQAGHERALFETMVFLAEWHAWVVRKSAASHRLPSLRPRALDGDTEVEVRQLVARILQHVHRGSTRQSGESRHE